MKILIVSIVDPVHSSYSRLHAIASHLSKKHSVTILSVKDAWKQGQMSASIHISQFHESLPNVEVIYLSDKDRSIVTQELFSKHYLKKIIGNRSGREFNLIIDYGTITIGRNASKIHPNAPRIFDLADDVPDMIKISDRLPRGTSEIGSRIARRLIHRSIEASDLIAGTTPLLFEKYGVPEEKRLSLPNGIPEDFLNTIHSDEVIDSRKYQDEFLMAYVGVLREWVDFQPVLEAMVRIGGDRKIRLLIIGSEGNPQRLIDQAKSMGILPSISMIGTVPHREILKYLVACDCGIIPFSESETSKYALPLKLFEYFSAGLPVISTRIKAIEDEFQEEILVYKDSEDLAEILSNLMNHRLPMGAVIRERRMKILKNYTWDAIFTRLDDAIEMASKRGS